MEPNTEGTSEPATPRGKLLSADELSDWGNNTRMVEPGTRTEDGRIVGGTEAAEPALDTIDKSIDNTVVDEAEEEQQPLVTVEDPGEFTPKDYSFQVTVFDSEGKNAKQVTVRSPEQWDELLETDPNLGSAAALAKGLRLAAKMEGNTERDKADYDVKKAEFDQATEAEKTRVAALTSMEAEINYLGENGDLPAVDAKYVNADWSDPDVAKQPGIKERIALLSFMRNENNRRTRLGLKPMTSVLDAFNAFERQNSKTRRISATKLAGEQRKAAGAIVAPSSPAPSASAPKGISVGRGGSLRDLAANGW